MSDDFSPTIATLQEHLRQQEEEARSTKRLINQLCQRSGKPLVYTDVDSEAAISGTIRRDEFYGVPLASAIKKFLEKRRNVGPATVNEIYSALVAGGFKFEAKNDANAKRALYISLAKNSYAFHKLPGKSDEEAVFGLLEWYPDAKAEEKPKKVKKTKKAARTAEAKPVTKPVSTPEPAKDAAPSATKKPEPAHADDPKGQAAKRKPVAAAV